MQDKERNLQRLARVSSKKILTNVPPAATARIHQLESACRCAAEALRIHDPQSPTALETERVAAGYVTITMIKPEDLTDEMLAGYFGEHCECRPLDIERTGHSHDCDDDLCDDVRVALGGRPHGCRYRSSAEAIIHAQAAKRRICEDIIEQGRGPTLLAALGQQLLRQARLFNNG